MDDDDDAAKPKPELTPELDMDMDVIASTGSTMRPKLSLTMLALLACGC
jgi:hypothetical protein